MRGMQRGKRRSGFWLIGLIVMVGLGCASPFGDPPPWATRTIIENPITPGNPVATPTIRFSGELALLGIYEPQDQSAAGRQFQQRMSDFEQETHIKVNYEGKSRDFVTEIVQTYLAAGQPLDLAPVQPEKVSNLAKNDTLLPFEKLGLAQLSSPYLGDSACLIEGQRYCAIDQTGLAWIVPKNAANPSGAAKLLLLLVK